MAARDVNSMTIQEAIERLEINKNWFEYEVGQPTLDAIDMAITSLEAWKKLKYEIVQEDLTAHHNRDEQKMLDWAKWLVNSFLEEMEKKDEKE